jgi:hypothetical protein
MRNIEDLPDAVSLTGLGQHADTQLSIGARLGYVALLLVGLASAGAIGSLWLTEPALPLRTQIAFASMVAIGLAWATFAVRVLTSRQTLLARHRVIAARMSVAFTSAYLIGMLILAYARDSAAAWAAAVVGATMLAVALTALIHSQRKWTELMQRRENLARQLGRAGY